MIFKIESLLKKENIDTFGILPYEKTEKINEGPFIRRKIDQAKIKSVIIFAIPYLTKACGANISKYAVAKDYHYFVRTLENKLGEELKNEFPNENFYFFTDDSPIDERKAASLCGIGVIGKNGLVITEKYSSFIFIGEIFTTAKLDEKILENTMQNPCVDCNACINACPKKILGICLSALTQKKGVLDENEAAAIKKYGTAWGCDICQDVCPVTKRAIQNGTIYSSIPFFREDIMPMLDIKAIENMPDKDFNLRAFAWRKRKTVLRNLEILENSENKE